MDKVLLIVYAAMMRRLAVKMHVNGSFLQDFTNSGITNNAGIFVSLSNVFHW